MDKYYNMIISKLETKRNELDRNQKSFLIMCNSEMQTQCFERNAINDLITMQKLKTEIAELEYQEIILRAQIKK